MYKQSKNPYLNLMKSIKKGSSRYATYKCRAENLAIYKKILISLENELKDL